MIPCSIIQWVFLGWAIVCIVLLFTVRATYEKRIRLERIRAAYIITEQLGARNPMLADRLSNKVAGAGWERETTRSFLKGSL